MTLSQKIAEDKQCRQDAKAFSTNDSDELYQNAWLKVYSYEERNPIKASEVKNHKGFFFRVLKSEFIDLTRRQKANRQIFIDSKFSSSTSRRGNLHKTYHSYFDNIAEVKDVEYKDYLYEWLEEKPSDEMNLFYKNIINLVIICGSVKGAVSMCPIGKTKFNHYLQEAKQKFKDDFNRNANPDYIHSIDVV